MRRTAWYKISIVPDSKKEMLMRKTLRRSLWDQPELFRTTPQRPTWRVFPSEVRQRALQLLARLMRTAHNHDQDNAHDRSGAVAKEVGDE
jgi:hypothetical protein